MLVGCAAKTYKDFNPANLKPDEGIAIGKVAIKYNGKDLNTDCFICFNSANGPCQKLTNEGYVFQNVKKDGASISRVACKDSSMQHYNVTGATFTQGNSITYFGEVKIEWTNNGGFKTSDLFGAVGAIISESKNDGKIKMSVSRGNFADVVKVYSNQTKSENLKSSTSMAKVGK
jgi:hypothetical protein